MSAPTYRFENHGRSRGAIMVLLLVWCVILLLIWRIQLAHWIAVGILLFTLPAAWEVLANPRSTLTLSDRHLTWQTPRISGELPVAQIKHIRFDTRLDLSVRITLCLLDGRKIRLPHAATPPHQRFEQELRTRGIQTERHHFSLIG